MATEILGMMGLPSYDNEGFFYVVFVCSSTGEGQIRFFVFFLNSTVGFAVKTSSYSVV